MLLSENIMLTRQKLLLNQTEFASELHASLATVSRWEIGKSIPNISAMKSIKTLCDNKGLPYEEIETAWIKARMEAKK